ncbi:MAG: ParB/RepB/Spo0J family partition protein [Firmicutes bacterium]|nr:ParB/RepB/Spo0J family partition protein [Bacillota bacterium]
MAIKRGLGKGLSALISGAEEEYDNATRAPLSLDAEAAAHAAAATELAIEKISPNLDQPRKRFDDVAMSDMINSVRVHGLISPIIVVEKKGGYMIIAGERRYRAAKGAGLKTIPAIVRDYTDQQIKELSLIENLQREDLNPIETANAIKQLMDEFRFTQEEVADRVGKSRSAVANLLRLLTLSHSVIDLVALGRLSEGHARCLVTVKAESAQLQLAMQGVDGKLTVRDFEKLVKNFLSPKASKDTPPVQSAELKDLVTRMQRVFATKVGALGNDKKGRIHIDYYTRDDLDRIVEFVEILEGLKS